MTKHALETIDPTPESPVGGVRRRGSLRIAPTDDPALIDALTRAAYAEYGYAPGTTSALKETVEAVCAQLANGTEALAAWRDGVPVACVRFQAEGDALYFHRLSVDPKFRRQGLASALLDALEAEALDRGLSRLTCSVRLAVTGNVALYARRGFVQIGERSVCRDGTGVPTGDLEKALPAGYLGADAWIETAHPAIVAKARELGSAQAAYTFVRDGIAHSWDIQASDVTATASEVLAAGHGICYAKSHLLAALLRALGTPSGIAYQKLVLFDDPADGYSVHALNTALLDGAWVKLDARGNKPGVDAQFCGALAFPVRPALGECDYPRNFSTPHPAVTEALSRGGDLRDLYRCGLPGGLDEA